MTDVFISYARRDSEEFAQRLTRALEAAELDVWVDLEDIPAASDWQRDLSEGVLASEYVCFVISPASVASEHCHDELNQAVDRNKRLVPIFHKAVPDAEVPEPLRRLNWIPQRGVFEDDFDRHVETTIAAVRTDLERLRQHTRWEQRASEWEERGRDPSLLARGSEMREAEDWLAAQANSEPQPTARQIEFVSRSRRASSRRQRLTLAVSLVALAISVGLGIAALIERNDARNKADLARSNELSASAMANLDSDPELSLILATKAAETTPTERSEQALADAVSTSTVRAQIHVTDKPHMARESPDGKEVVVATDAGADLYSADGQHLIKHLEGEGGIYDTVFTPDSRFVLTAGEDKEIRRYALPSGDLVDTIPTPTDVSSIAVSQRSILIAATTSTGDVELYRLDGSHYLTLHAGKQPIVTVDFAARRAALVSAGLNGKTIVWDVVTGKRLGVLSGKAGRYRDADVSSDGSIAVTVDQRGIAQEWDVAGRTPIGPPLNHLVSQGRTKSVDFSPDESSVVLGMADGRARIVDLRSRETVGTYGGHHGPIRQAEFGADGQALATTGLSDGLVRVFDVSSLVETIPTDSRPAAVALSPDGKLLAVAELNGEFQLFDESTGAQRQAFQIDDQALRAIAFSPDGKRLAFGGDDGKVRLWDIAGKHYIGDPLVSAASIRDLAFDPSGARLLSTGDDGHARLWDLSTGHDTSILDASYTLGMDWSESGDRVAIAVQDYRNFYVGVLDPDSPDDVVSVKQPQAIVADLSADGALVATGGSNGSSAVWDATTGSVVSTLADQPFVITSASFVPGDTRVVTTSQGGTRISSASSGLRLASIDGQAADAVATDDGQVVIGRSDVNSVEVHDCEPCDMDADQLLDLARTRITRDPTEAEKALYGLD